MRAALTRIVRPRADDRSTTGCTRSPWRAATSRSSRAGDGPRSASPRSQPITAGSGAPRRARGSAVRAADQLEPFAAQRAGDEAGIVGRDGTTGESRQRPLRGRDPEGTPVPAFPLGRERDQRALRVEKPHRITHHLLHDTVELQGACEDVGQLLERGELRQAAVQLVRRPPAVALAPLAAPLEVDRSPAEPTRKEGDEGDENERHGSHNNNGCLTVTAA